MMSDWIGLTVIVVIIVGGMWFFVHSGKPYDATPEEFERRAKLGGGARAGLFGLMQLLNPKGAKAVEVQRDLKSGYYNKKRAPGDGDDEPDADAQEGQSSHSLTENSFSDAEDKNA